jgi:hypothetical protein
MLAVQQFELSLGMVWLVTRRSFRSPRTVTPQSIQADIDRFLHVTQRGAPQEFFSQLEDTLDPSAARALRRLIAIRNNFAHAFLRERLRVLPDRLFKEGTVAELDHLTSLFEDARRQLDTYWQEQHRAKAGTSSYEGQGPTYRALIERTARQLLHGASWTEHDEPPTDP